MSASERERDKKKIAAAELRRLRLGEAARALFWVTSLALIGVGVGLQSISWSLTVVGGLLWIDLLMWALMRRAP